MQLTLGLSLLPTLAPIGGLAAQEGLPVWTVDPEPTVRIGVAEGLDSEMFVRVSDAALLPGGGVVVLDAGALEIRFYDAAGGALAVAGREGEGPGELLEPFGSEIRGAAGGGTPLRIFVTADTNERGVREYDDAGTLVRTIELLDVRDRLGDAEWSAILDTLPTMRGREEAIRRLRADMDLPDRTPWVDRLIVDPRGRLWAISRRPSGATLAVVYEDGAPVAQVELPTVARLLEIGDARIVALERDALDVETVAVFRFRGR